MLNSKQITEFRFQVLLETSDKFSIKLNILYDIEVMAEQFGKFQNNLENFKTIEL